VFDRPPSGGGSEADTVDESGDSPNDDPETLGAPWLGVPDGVPDVDGDPALELGPAEAEAETEALEVGAEPAPAGTALLVAGRGELDVGRAVGFFVALRLGLGVGFFVAVGVGVAEASRTTTVPRIPPDGEPWTVQ
jgi:hypothetical protein